MQSLRTLIFTCLLVAGVGGCATPPSTTDRDAWSDYREINDPVEPANRAVFAFNQSIDRSILKPAATAYNSLVPAWVREGVGNMLDHLRTPVILVNDLLQGEIGRAVNTFNRFWINTALGFGFMDMAGAMGLEGHDEDFGQTLAVWGVPEGPFVMLPLFGPSNPRDSVGLIVDFLTDPFRTWATNTEREHLVWARAGTHSVHARAGLLEFIDDLEKTSLDFYAAIRSLYRQRRSDEISNGRGSANAPVPDLSETPQTPSFDTPLELSRR
ncbi:MAG: VacJ family lipoprotein [Rhodospirillaceae bacterium]|jgi:phospholipid-binding lipoprotein MlaA|nr:VacJ family lipoprotein [Rhodospirillaceae bacterium]